MCVHTCARVHSSPRVSKEGEREQRGSNTGEGSQGVVLKLNRIHSEVSGTFRMFQIPAWEGKAIFYILDRLSATA